MKRAIPVPITEAQSTDWPVWIGSSILAVAIHWVAVGQLVTLLPDVVQELVDTEIVFDLPDVGGTIMSRPETMADTAAEAERADTAAAERATSAEADALETAQTAEAAETAETETALSANATESVESTEIDAAETAQDRENLAGAEPDALEQATETESLDTAQAESADAAETAESLTGSKPSEAETIQTAEAAPVETARAEPPAQPDRTSRVESNAPRETLRAPTPTAPVAVAASRSTPTTPPAGVSTVRVPSPDRVTSTPQPVSPRPERVVSTPQPVSPRAERIASTPQPVSPTVERVGTVQPAQETVTAALQPPEDPSPDNAPLLDGGSESSAPAPGEVPDGEIDALERARYGAILDHLRGFDGGGCFAALPVLDEESGLLTLDAFGETDQDLTEFRDGLEAAAGTVPNTDLRPVSQEQCDGLFFLTTLEAYPGFSLYFDMPVRDIRSGERLRGTIRNVAGRHIHLLLVDDDGLVQSADVLVEQDPVAATFNIPLALTGEVVETKQLLLAIASPTPLQGISSFNNQPANEFFLRLRAEMLLREIEVDAAMVAFTVR